MTEGTDRPLISVVLLSHGRFDLLRQALASIERQSYRPLEVVLVDNEGPDSPRIRDWVRREHPAVRLVENANTGYAGGMNRGLREATGEYVEFHADDIVHEPEYFERIIAALPSLDGWGAVNGMVYEGPGSRTIRYCGGLVHFGADFYLTIHGLGQPDDGRFRQAFVHGFAAGANLFMRRAEALAMGGFDEDYFMYYEDVDLSLRLARRGARLWLVPAAACHHLGHPLGTMTDAGRTYADRNVRLLYRKHAGPWLRAVRRLFLATGGGRPLRTVLARLSGHGPAGGCRP